MVPLGHGTHNTEPGSSWWFPAGQDWHVVPAKCGWNVLIGQGLQAPVAPSKTVPGAHGTHAVDPGSGWWCPSGQSLHSTPAGSG
eukprot:5649453-Prymnesium_polylepis.1